jgi:hypothetical protein
MLGVREVGLGVSIVSHTMASAALVTGYSRQTAACRIEDIIENRECRGGEYAGWYVVAEFPELRAQQLKLVA